MASVLYFIQLGRWIFDVVTTWTGLRDFIDDWRQQKWNTLILIPAVLIYLFAFPQICPKINEIENGFVNCTKRSWSLSNVGATCKFTCNDKYELLGPNKTTCSGDEKWVPDPPTKCDLILCPKLHQPLDGTMQCSDENIVHSECNFTCKDTHWMKGQEKIVCGRDHEWSGNAPTCELIHCPKLNHLLDGTAKCTDDNKVDSTCTFTCKHTHLIKGPKSIVCNRNGKWSDDSPTCELIRCRIIDNPTDGKVTCTGRTVDSECTFTCKDTHEMKGQEKIVCGRDHEWSGDSPTCEIILCPELEMPENGRLTCTDGNTAFSECTFMCEETHQIKGVEKLKCKRNREWSDKIPTCELIRCPELHHPHHGRVECTNKNAINSECSFACSKTHWLKGPEKVICGRDHTWSDNSPTCGIKLCRELNNPTGGSVTCSDRNKVGSVCAFKCKDTHRIQGPEEIVCRVDQTWSGDSPICLLRKCQTPPNVEHGKVNCPDKTYAVGSVCEVECIHNHVFENEAQQHKRVECQSNEEWTMFPTCICPSCKISENCEHTTSWQVFKNGISSLEFSSNFKINFGGRDMQCERDGNFYKWKWVWKCRCTDLRSGHSLRCDNYKSRFGACEHATAELIRQMGQSQSEPYPKPCDPETMVTGCG